MSRIALLWLVFGLPQPLAVVGALWWLNRPPPMPSEAEQDQLYSEAIQFLAHSERSEVLVWEGPVRDGELDDDLLRVEGTSCDWPWHSERPDPFVHALPGIFALNKLGYAHRFGPDVAPGVRRDHGLAAEGTTTVELSRIAFDSTRERAAVVVSVWRHAMLGSGVGRRLVFHRSASGAWVIDCAVQIWIT